MHISISWLKRYVDIHETSEELAEMLTILGFEAEDGIDISSINNVVTAHIKSVEKHPNADKLTICTVDDGNEVHQVICGAPNVKPGLNVFLAQIGAEFSDGFKIKKAKIRGVESFGMLCSEKELNLSDNHSGIMELSSDVTPGIPFQQYYNDHLLSIELDITPNRPDALSHYGIAREIAIKTSRELRLFSTYEPKIAQDANENVKVIIDDPDGCPRYIAGVVKNIEIGPSPDWMIQCLTSAGQRSINNVVDISNFVLLEMGHPTHIFDFRLIPTNTIGVSRAKDGQIFTTLDEEKRTLNSEHLLITDGETPIALAGIMGGLNTAVKEDTHTVLIESAYFDPITIRKGSKSLGMLTEASRRFERGADIEGAYSAFWRIVELLENHANGKMASNIVDNYAKRIQPPNIVLRHKRATSILGFDISESFIKDSLEKLGVQIQKQKTDEWLCIPPSHRPDLEREIDLIEEIVRIHGYDQIPDNANFSSLYPDKEPDPTNKLKDVFTSLKGFGYQQCYNNSLQSLTIAGLAGSAPVETINPLGEQMAVLRTCLFPGLLQNADYNANNGNKDVMLFEYGQIHQRNGDGFENIVETSLISGITTGLYTKKDVHFSNVTIQNLYLLKGTISTLIQSLLGEEPSYRTTQSTTFHNAFDVVFQNIVIGNIGVFSDSYNNKLSINLKDIYGFELFVEPLLELLNIPTYYKKVSTYPKMQRDLNFVFDESTQSQDVIIAIMSKQYNNLTDVVPTNIFHHENLGPGKKSIVFNFTFQSNTKTLEDTEVNPVINEIISVVKSGFDGKLRAL